jgi:hypothetical protein
LQGRVHSKQRDAEAVQYHYNASNEFLSGNGPFPQSLRQSTVLLARRSTLYVSAQDLDFLDLAKNYSVPNQKRAGIHPVLSGFFLPQLEMVNSSC